MEIAGLFMNREYLHYWEKEVEDRLCGLTSRVAFKARAEPDPRDDLLLEELRRSVQAMPLDLDTVKRLNSALKELSDTSNQQPQQKQLNVGFLIVYSQYSLSTIVLYSI